VKNSAMHAGGSLQYQTDVQGRFQFSEEIKDSSLKSLVVFIIAKRRVKSDTGCGGVVGECDIPFAAATAVQTMLPRFCSLSQTAHSQWKWWLT
jgi:hypothetical protein